MKDYSTKVMLTLCTLMTAVNLACMVTDAAPTVHIAMAVLLVSMVGSAMLCAFIFPEHSPGHAPGDPPAPVEGPYQVTVSWYDEAAAAWRYRGTWLGWAPGSDLAVRLAVDKMREDPTDQLRGEVAIAPEHFAATMNSTDCAQSGSHGKHRDAAGYCRYCCEAVVGA